MGINFRSVKGFYVVVSHNGVPEKQTKKEKAEKCYVTQKFENVAR